MARTPTPRVVMQVLLLSKCQFVLKMIGVLMVLLHSNLGWIFLFPA